MSIHENGMLARLRINQWTARKYDGQISHSLNNLYNAKEDTSRVNKLLVPKEMIHPVINASSQARAWFAWETSPWLDDGVRILATDKYFEFLGKMGEVKSNWEDKVEVFLGQYEDFVEFHAASHLGGMFKQSDYPSVESVRSRFDFNLHFMPVPHQDDWRVETDDVVKAQLKAELIAQLKDAEQMVYQDIAERVVSKVGHIRERLIKDERFRRESFEAIQVLAETLPALNILGDSRIDQLVGDLKVLAAADLKDIRKNDDYRDQVITQTDTILTKMETIHGASRETSESEVKSGADAAVFRLTGT